MNKLVSKYRLLMIDQPAIFHIFVLHSNCHTVFTRISAAALIKLFPPQTQRLFVGNDKEIFPFK